MLPPDDRPGAFSTERIESDDWRPMALSFQQMLTEVSHRDACGRLGRFSTADRAVAIRETYSPMYLLE